MKETQKIRVAVLYGGRSPEHEVSILSASNVIEYLDRSLFEVVPIKIDKQGTWFLEHTAPAPLTHESTSQKFFTPAWLKEPETVAKSLQAQAHLELRPDRLFDVIFPVMHGTFSEDGTIQGMLELADVPYVGCGVLASAIGMDKDVARRLVSHAGLPTVPYIAVKKGQWLTNADNITAEINQKFTFPVFVKPANQGSSIGVSKVKSPEGLTAAIEQAFHYDTKILIEQGITASELEVSILEAIEDGVTPFASVVGEIRPNAEFYSYDAKYTDGGADLIIPAEISTKTEDTLRDLAIKIFGALGAEGMARIDFFVEKNTQQIYFNEMNSIPGFTLFSMYPQLLQASGISYTDLLTRLVMLAIKRFEEKQRLERSYS
jgi:D-alanine-D-alanine ligase